MIHIRGSKDRGHADHGWLKSYHSFSFADYYDPEQMGFSVLRVINEDSIQGGAGFPTHGHRDMEILTYVTAGALAHKDSMGNSAVIRPGEVQRMSAGTGVKHSEMNALADEPTSLLQIWILPEKIGIAPSYEQKDFSKAVAEATDGIALAVSKTGEQGSISINQDFHLYVGQTKKGEKAKLPLMSDRRGWLQLISGQAELGGFRIASGDGAAIQDEAQPELRNLDACHFIFMEMPA